MSAGIRSGVNWMRFQSSPKTTPKASTSRVLARPGTPISKPCPPESSVMSDWSITSRCPKIVRPMPSRTRAKVAAARSAWATAGPFSGSWANGFGVCVSLMVAILAGSAPQAYHKGPFAMSHLAW